MVRMEERRGAYRVWWGETEEMIPLGRLRGKWEYVIKKNLQEVGRRVWTALVWLTRGTAEGSY